MSIPVNLSEVRKRKPCHYTIHITRKLQGNSFMVRHIDITDDNRADIASDLRSLALAIEQKKTE